MKQLAIRITMLAAVAFVAVSCQDSKMNDRVQDLERRVADLERGGTARNNSTPADLTTLASNTPNANAVQPVEVEAIDGPVSAFSFPVDSHDFGTINEGDVVEHVFKFTNNGEAPLIIENARASCGCTVPNYPKEPIPVGGSGEIQVRFDSKGKPGVQSKTVTITANTNPKTTKIYIKSNVVPKAGAIDAGK